MKTIRCCASAAVLFFHARALSFEHWIINKRLWNIGESRQVINPIEEKKLLAETFRSNPVGVGGRRGGGRRPWELNGGTSAQIPSFLSKLITMKTIRCCASAAVLFFHARALSFEHWIINKRLWNIGESRQVINPIEEKRLLAETFRSNPYPLPCSYKVPLGSLPTV